MLRGIVVALMLVGLSSSADAVPKLKDQMDEAAKKICLTGVLDGISAYRAADETVHGKQMLFCIPPNLALTVEQAEDIIMRYAKRLNRDDLPLATYLVSGLQYTFPCQH